MNGLEKRLVLGRFVRLLTDCKNVINLLRRGVSPDRENKIDNLLIEIEGIVGEYYLNLDICSQCGHPIPTVPSQAMEEYLTDILDSYIDLYELKTGEEFDDSVFGDQVRIEKIITTDDDKSKIQVPESMKNLNKRAKKYTHIKGTLMKVN